MIGVAKRLVECRYFRWLPGMRDLGGNFYLGQRANAPEGVHMWAGFDQGSWEWSITEFGLPDLEDPATLGCVLALVRNAWKDDGIACVTGSYTAESGYRFRIVGGKRITPTRIAFPINLPDKIEQYLIRLAGKY